MKKSKIVFSDQSLRRFLLSFSLILAGISISSAQVFSDKVVGKKNEERIDSLKQSEYEFLLPIWGAQAVKAGFDIPYSAGLSINYLSQRSSILIDNLQVGVNNSALFNLDEIVRFNEATARTSGLNVRPMEEHWSWHAKRITRSCLRRQLRSRSSSRDVITWR